MGSPDPFARQLDGMGGGLSSLSKVCIVGPSSQPDADVDYTKAQVQLREARVDYHSNCGNMSSAIDNFVKTGKLSMKDFARSVIQDLIAIQMKAQAMAIFRMMFGWDLLLDLRANISKTEIGKANDGKSK